MIGPLRPSPSPRVRRLLADGDVAAWWADVAAVGGPLVELADVAGYRWVTFSWRGNESVVLPLVNGVVDRDRRESGEVSAHVMDALPGTDVRYVTYCLPADLRASYVMCAGDAVPACDRSSWLEAVAAAVPDPWNPRDCAGAFGRRASLLELPDAPGLPYERPVEPVPRGRVRELHRDGRRVWVYVPAGAPVGPLPVAVFLDGDIWVREAPLAPLLDELIAAKVVPPLVGVLVDSVDWPSRRRDLTLSESFVDWLRELLAWSGVEFDTTSDPARTVIAGQSLGGLTAAFAGLIAGDRFGNALCQSGSFYWPDSDPYRLPRMFAAAESVRVRLFLQTGRLEPLLLPGVDELCRVLDGRAVQYWRRDFTGGHERVCWRRGIAEGLIALSQAWV